MKNVLKGRCVHILFQRMRTMPLNPLSEFILTCKNIPPCHTASISTISPFWMIVLAMLGLYSFEPRQRCLLLPKGVPLKESEISRGLVSPGQCPLKKKRFWLGNQQEMVWSGPEHQMRKFLNNGKRVS